MRDDEIMPGGIIRIETEGSWWLIDEANLRYCRFPKTEGGREHPEWGNEDAGRLQDAVWHAFTGRWQHNIGTGLQIETHIDEDGKHIGLFAPPTMDQRMEFLRQIIEPMGEFQP